MATVQFLCHPCRSSRDGVAPGRAEQRARILNNLEPQFWFYLLPIVWLFLLIELYDPHVAGSGRRTTLRDRTRGIPWACRLLSRLYRQRIYQPAARGCGHIPTLCFPTHVALAYDLYPSLQNDGATATRAAARCREGWADSGELYQSLGTRSFNLIGYVDDDRAKVGKTICGLRVLGSSIHLLNLIDVYHISDLVIAINGEIQGATFQSILDAQEKGVEVTRMPILYEEMTGRVPIHHLESDWIIRSFVDGLHVSGFYELTKRLLDIFGGLVGLLIFAITCPFLSLAVAVDSGFPVFYSQPRLGKGGLIFKIYKYRTMRRMRRLMARQDHPGE